MSDKQDDDKPAIPKRVSFIASIDTGMNAISFDGMGDGGRVRLVIPATEVGAMILVQRYFTGKSFRVILEQIDDGKG